MSSNLSVLFHPTAIAVVGATPKPHRVGHVVMRNLLAGGFEGPIMPVNPKYNSVSGVWAYPEVAALPATPDLAIVCSPPPTVPGVVEQLTRRGTKAAIVLTELDDAGRARVSAAVKGSGMRLLGDSSLGVLVPKIGLNASFGHTGAQKGKVAFVSQSGALCAAVLDWAQSRGIGFSHFVSLGASLDVDFGDVMDYLANDAGTRAILLYVEDLRERRNFMSAGRAAARNKPVLVVKGNRFRDEDDITAALASGSLATSDEIFDAAVRRAGMLRVDDVDELFAAFETLARARPIGGDRLAILSNAGGTGTMAMDALLAGGGHLAQFSAETAGRLDKALVRWSRTNPAEIPIDASAKRYADGLSVLVEAAEADAVLVMHAPNALIEPEQPARAVVEVVKEVGGRVLTSWVGGAGVAEAQRIFSQAGIPTYDTPGRAVRAFLHMANYRRNQELLMQTPPSVIGDFRPATGTARRVIDTALAAGRDTLTEPEAKAVLSAYGFNVVETHLAANAAEAAEIASYLGFPVALTIQAPGLTRKWDVGGVALNLETREAVASAAAAMVGRLEERRPGTAHQGFAVQRMVSRQNTRQLIVGVATDRVFGPVILFGEGGRAVEIIRDHAIGLPPLNPVLAHELIGRTRIARLLGAYLDRPAADEEAITNALLRVSQMIVDLPEMVELDVNPLFADDKGVTVVDAHMKVRRFEGAEGSRLAIRPYPAYLEETATLKDGCAVVLRPIRPEDQAAHLGLLSSLTPEDLRFRFFGRVGDVSKGQIARFTQIDYDREMAFIASRDGETLGAVRTVTDAENRRAELAITLRPSTRGTGLAMALMDKMIRYHRDQGTAEIAGEIMAENVPMQKLAQKAGFTLKRGPDGDTYEMLLALK
jgi:acetyltransferase